MPQCRRNSAYSSVPKAVPEAAEESAFLWQGRRGRRRAGALPGHRLVVVGTRDGVDRLRLVEVLGAGDLRHEADEYAVAHHLCLQTGGAVGIPDRLTFVAQHDAYPELVDAGTFEMRGNSALAKCVDDPAGPVFVHSPQTSVSVGPDWRITPATRRIVIV